MAFGFIGKAFKGIKKVAKKIGKGIKKIAKKVLGAIGKIGPIGQLALMFIGIPPVISNFFGGIGGAITGVLGKAGTVVSNFATKIAPNLTKGLGKAFNAIKTAGQGAYNTITEAIGNGVDRAGNFLKGEGFTLSEGRTSIFNRPPSTPNVTPTKAALDQKFDTNLPVEDVSPNLDLDLKPNKPVLDTETFEITGGNMVDASPSIDSSLLSPDKTLGERAKDYISEGIEGITDTLSDPKKLAAETIKGGVISGGTTALARSIAGPPPTQKVMHSSLSDFMTPTTQRPLDAATWNNVNNAYLKAGSSFGAFGDAATPYYAEMAGLDEDTFNTLVPTPTSSRPSTPSFFN